MKTVLDLDQINRLQKLNINIPEPSLYWARCVDKNPRAATHYGKWILVKGKQQRMSISFQSWEFIPAFDIYSLLIILPANLIIGFNINRLDIYPEDNNKWTVKYKPLDKEDSSIEFTEDELIDALYNLVCWCIDNEYIK